jgi:glycosyltransferase involved in cell wall biosynthesis
MTSFQKSKVSFILPTFNAEKYLKETIKSIINQSYKNYELIIIDNVSDDSTKKILEEFKNLNKEIELKILFKRTKNLAEALNLGIKASSGKYIARIDSDDIIRKNRIIKQVKFLENNKNYHIVGTNAFRFKKNSHYFKPFLIHHNDIYLKISLIFNSPFVHPSIMISKKFIIDNDFFYNSKFDECEDYELWCRIFEKTMFKNLKYYGIFYRVHEESASFKKKDKLDSYFKKSNLKLLSKMNINLTEKQYFFFRKISSLDIHSKDDFDNLNNIYISILLKIESALSKKYDKLSLKNFLEIKYLRFSLRAVITKNYHPTKLINSNYKIGKLTYFLIYFLFLMKINL